MQIDSSPRTLGMAGGALTVLGVFTPIVSMPIIGNISFMQNGHGYGVVLLAAGIAGTLLAHRGNRTGMLIAAIAAAVMMVITFIGIQMRIQQIADAIGGKAGGLMSSIADLMIQSIHMQWGWGVLILGIGLQIYAVAGIRRIA